MTSIRTILNRVVTALCLVATFSFASFADEERLNELFERLRSPNLAEWESIEQQIWSQWSKSGSESMDVLLDRGRDALEEGDIETAIAHLTALTDHAPEFAEGWNARATAYFRAGLYGPSVEDIGRTLALNPRHFGAMSGLAMILAELGDTEGALELYRRASNLNPHRTEFKDAITRLEAQVQGTDL